MWSMLIVDDEPGMRNFLVKTLVPRCHTVLEAGSAEEGAAIVQAVHIDLIILDISLPGRSGRARPISYSNLFGFPKFSMPSSTALRARDSSVKTTYSSTRWLCVTMARADWWAVPLP